MMSALDPRRRRHISQSAAQSLNSVLKHHFFSFMPYSWWFISHRLIRLRNGFRWNTKSCSWLSQIKQLYCSKLCSIVLFNWESTRLSVLSNLGCTLRFQINAMVQINVQVGKFAKLTNKLLGPNKHNEYRESVVGSVIQATGTLEF